jgi:hypothetical protein
MQYTGGKLANRSISGSRGLEENQTPRHGEDEKQRSTLATAPAQPELLRTNSR